MYFESNILFNILKYFIKFTFNIYEDSYFFYLFKINISVFLNVFFEI